MLHPRKMQHLFFTPALPRYTMRQKKSSRIARYDYFILYV